MQMRLTPFGLDALQRGFAQAPALAQRELMTTMRDAVALLASEAKGTFPKHSGLTRNSIEGDAFATPLGVLGVVASPSPVATFVDLGTRPHHPPVEPLVQWVADMLGKTGPDGERIARAIAWKIGKRGTPARHLYRAALDKHWTAITRMFEAAAGRIAAGLGGGAKT